MLGFGPLFKIMVLIVELSYTKSLKSRILQNPEFSKIQMFNLHLNHQFFPLKFPRPSSSSFHRRSHDSVTLRRREFHRPIFLSVVRSGTDGGGYKYGSCEGDELTKLLSLLPETMQAKLLSHENLHDLVEIVLDLGRVPLARFPSGDFVLSPNPISLIDLNHATSQVLSTNLPVKKLLFLFFSMD